MASTSLVTAAGSGKTNPDLAKERQGATFDSERMTYFLHGGRDRVRRRRYVRNLAFSDPNIRQKTFTYLTQDEAYSEAMRKAVYMVKRLKELNLTNPMEIGEFKEAAGAHEGSPLGLHVAMFLPTIVSMGTQEQKDYWLPKCQSYEVVGTYAQTELGHGTFIRGLETTATFDPRTDEFVLNTPTLSSIKWWPGSLGKTTNHCIVMAQLYTKGKHCGVYPLIVQTRSVVDHKPMPGVELGDIGPKFGYESIDNGFLRLNNVRVPRSNLLMKHATVDKDGTFRQVSYDKLTYGSMMYIRSYISYDMARALSQACTIAIRYSAVRRQSKINPKDAEPQVLDFVTQQYKLFPLLATAFVFHVAAMEVVTLFGRVSQDIAQGDLENLPLLHSTSAGLKAFTSWTATTGIEQCRMACGGHGYAQASGFPKIYKDATPANTYEGENTVMALQTARYLMKCNGMLQRGDKLPSFLSYLGEGLKNRVSRINSSLNEFDLLDAFQYRATRYIISSSKKMSDLMKKGRTAEEAWNLTSVDLVKSGMAHCEVFAVKLFYQKLTDPAIDVTLRPVLTTLYKLYCCHNINKNLGDYLLDGYMSNAQAAIIKDKELSLMAELRPNAVALVDSFDFPDQILDSCLGRQDGNVYEAMYEYAKNSPLNATEVHDSYYKHLRPLIQEGRAQSKL